MRIVQHQTSERISIGGSDLRGTNTVERNQSAFIRYEKQSFGLYEVFVIDAKGKFIKNKTVKTKKTKKGISITEEKMMVDSPELQLKGTSRSLLNRRVLQFILQQKCKSSPRDFTSRLLVR